MKLSLVLPHDTTESYCLESSCQQEQNICSLTYHPELQLFKVGSLCSFVLFLKCRDHIDVMWTWLKHCSWDNGKLLNEAIITGGWLNTSLFMRWLVAK